MKRKRNWVYILLIIILVVPILVFYNAFNGNPISKMAAKSSLENYLKETYPDQDFHIDDGSYNFKISGYSFYVNKTGTEDQKKYNFDVTGFFQPSVTYDEIYYENLDRPLIEKLSDEASEEIRDVLKDIENIVEISVHIEVLKGTYAPTTEWSKGLKLEKPIQIEILMDAKDMSKEQLLEAAKSMQSALNAESYEYDRVNINANLFDGNDDRGYVKYGLAFESTDTLSLKDIKEFNQ